MVDKAITMDNLITITLSSSKRLQSLQTFTTRQSNLKLSIVMALSTTFAVQKDRASSRYKYFITAKWKFCSRFINLRLNAKYLPSYREVVYELSIGTKIGDLE